MKFKIEKLDINLLVSYKYCFKIKFNHQIYFFYLKTAEVPGVVRLNLKT